MKEEKVKLKKGGGTTIMRDYLDDSTIIGSIIIVEK